MRLPSPRDTDATAMWAHVNATAMWAHVSATAMWAHVSALPPRPSRMRPDLPEEIDEVIARGMAKDPAERYAGAGELAQAAALALGSASRLTRPGMSDQATNRRPALGALTTVSENP
ncbi:MAG TPA: hypothetical protein VNV42_02215 [Solirubrobacteraceae bacterium]|nr:hypothetical protein [Solirubrobacteraceae bacterium]